MTRDTEITDVSDIVDLMNRRGNPHRITVTGIQPGYSRTGPTNLAALAWPAWMEQALGGVINTQLLDFQLLGDQTETSKILRAMERASHRRTW